MKNILITICLTLGLVITQGRAQIASKVIEVRPKITHLRVPERVETPEPLITIPYLPRLNGLRSGPVVYSTAINISLDLAGIPDTRPTTWGTADAFASLVHFNAPPGLRTRIIHVYGDFVAWLRKGRIIEDLSCEVGFGLKTTAPDTSEIVDFPGYAARPYDNSFLWVQGFLTADTQGSRLPFDYQTAVGGLLENDNLLLVQSFVAINTTGLTIHMEPTLIITYQFEEE